MFVSGGSSVWYAVMCLTYGFLWILIDSYGFLWIPKDSHGIPKDSYSYEIPMDSYGTHANNQQQRHNYKH
jgi:hypothetical protein